MNNLIIIEIMGFLQSIFYCPYSEVVIKNEHMYTCGGFILIFGKSNTVM